MFTPRAATSYFVALLLFCTSFSITPAGAYAQQQQQTPTVVSAERERGIRLYEQGDTDGAIEALRATVKQHKDDADAWYYLGLALLRREKPKDAQKAFITALKLRPGFALAHANLASTLLNLNKFEDAAGEARNALALDPENALAHFVLGSVYLKEGATSHALEEAESALKTRADFEAALLLKSRVLLAIYAFNTPLSSAASPPSEEYLAARRSLLKEAAESLDKYLKLNPNAADAETWREQLEAMRFRAEFKERLDAESTVVSAKEVTTKARILSKPEPNYTGDARGAGTSGTVVLSAVLSSEGTVKYILVLRSLPKGLTEKAIEAARKIKFVPAIKDGRPVSQFVIIEYNFNVY